MRLFSVYLAVISFMAAVASAHAGGTTPHQFTFVSPQVGDKVLNVDQDGKEFTLELVKLEGQSRTWRRSNGCEWTDKPFAPAEAWSCPHPGGSMFVRLWKGDPTKMSIGNKFQWDRDSGYSRKCTVAGTETITVPLGTFKTFRIECHDGVGGGTDYVFNVAPELGGRQIRFKREGGASPRWSEVKEIVVNGLVAKTARN